MTSSSWNSRPFRPGVFQHSFLKVPLEAVVRHTREHFPATVFRSVAQGLCVGGSDRASPPARCSSPQVADTCPRAGPRVLWSQPLDGRARVLLYVVGPVLARGGVCPLRSRCPTDKGQLSPPAPLELTSLFSTPFLLQLFSPA